MTELERYKVLAWFAQNQGDYDYGYTNTPHFVLPLYLESDYIPLVSGESYILYGEALFNMPINNNLVSVFKCDIGAQYGNNFIITPTDDDIGTHVLDVEIREGKYIINKKRTAIKVATKINTGSKTILSIGDSLINRSWDDEMASVRAVFDSMAWTGVGTQDSDPDKNEGYSGKTYNWAVNDADSPFTKAGVVDVPAYFTDNSLSVPDFVFMRMGVNTAYGNRVDGMSESDLTTWIGYINELIDAFLAHDANVKIILSVPTICENSGDGWTANYPGDAYQDNYIENIHKMWESMYNEYKDNAYNARVYLSFAPLFLDRDDGYPKTDGVHNNGVHPDVAGYTQLGNALAATLNTLL